MNPTDIPAVLIEARAAQVKVAVAAVVAVPMEVAAVIGSYVAAIESNGAEELLAIHRDLSTVLPYYIHMVVGKWNGRAMRVEAAPALIKPHRSYVIWFAKEEDRMWQDISNNLLWGKNAEVTAYRNLVKPCIEEVAKIVIPLPSHIPRATLSNFKRWTEKQHKK